MPITGVVAFLLLKFFAYAAWCWLALEFLTVARPASPVRRVMGLALVRMVLGFGLGWPSVLALTVIAPGHNRLGLSIPALVLAFVCLRWLEWSFVGALAMGHAKQPRAVVLGTHVKEHAWRIGGLGVSFATDLAGVFGVGALGLIPC